MRYNKKNLVLAFSLFSLYLIISYCILNQHSIKNPSYHSLVSITTDPFSYYDIRTVAYIYSIFFLIIQNLVIIKNSQYILRFKNRSSIINSYLSKILMLSLGFVCIHTSIGIVLTSIFFNFETVTNNHFIVLSAINASVFFLYLISITLFLSILEIFRTQNTALILCVIVVISGYFLNNLFWTPLLDTRIFAKAYVDAEGLYLFEIIKIYIRQITVIVILIILKSIFIQRKDYIR